MTNPFELSPILREVLNKVPPADSPAPVDDDKSCLRALVELGLVVEPSSGTYALSDKGEEYMSLSELEQRRYAKQHPFCHFVDIENPGNLL